MNRRVSIDLAGRRLKDLAFEPFGKPEDIDGAMYGGLRRLHRVMLIMNRRGGTGQIVDFIDLHIERKRHVMPHKLEAWVIVKLVDIALGTGKEIVGTKNFVPLLEQSVDQMRTNETGAAGDKNALSAVV